MRRIDVSVERPTFHESWYRVADLRTTLLSGVGIHRQYFRGQLWYVLENPANSQYCRIGEDAYRFVGLLDGRRTVSDAWQLCNEQLGDKSPTQGEVIQLLGQLYAMNLLYADLPPDTEDLFLRYRKRIRREVVSQLMNLLFIRLPLIDPDQFLNRWVSVLGRVFSWSGLVLWLLLLAGGLYFVISNFNELLYHVVDVLAPGNLILLYLSLVIVKVCHEFSHAFACKKFGQLNQSRGEVHTMGVMFLVFLPLPYVDASSAWAFRNKWHRAIVGMAGVMAELAAAAVAVILWTRTSAGTLHSIAYNVMFVASISTILFNGNPLLRFDAYYVLSDLVEIPNLGQRSQNYIYYLIKRYCWGLKKAVSPAYCLGERIWFAVYAIASTVYRIFISIRILLFMNRRLPEELFILVPLLAFSAFIAWILVPLGRFIGFLVTGAELARNRLRAIGSTVGALVFIITLVGFVPMPDYCRVEGIVEPVRFAIVHAESDGFVKGFLPSESKASPDGPSLVTAVNPELDAEKKGLIAERHGLEVKWQIAEMQETAAAQIIDEQIDALDEKIARIESELAALNLGAPFEGTWISPDIEHFKDVYLHRGERIGFVGSLNDVIVRSTAGQNVAAMLIEQADRQVEIRVKGRPESELAGEIEKIFPAGLDLLPSKALGYPVGGAMPIRTGDPNHIRAAEKFFEIRIKPALSGSDRLLTGQRVVARIRVSPKPLICQWWQSARQLFQRRFHI
jgi:putative peptide zinc metalloprotease protein